MNEEALRRSEARFRGLVEASPAAIFIAEQRRFIYVNPAMAELCGRPREQLIGTDLLDVLHPAEREAAEDGWARRERNGSGHDRRELRIRTAAGTDRWLDLTMVRIELEGHAQVLGTGIDISDRKRLEATTQQRQQFEALGRLAGGVAHDFNNLLLVIRGHVEQLLEGLQPGDVLRQAVEAIENAAARATALTEHLLAFGRRQTLRTRTVDVRELLLVLRTELRSDAEGHVTPVVRVPDHLPPVRADEQRLEQVFRSLYANARDAMPEGGEVVFTADLVPVDEAMREGRPWLPAGGSWVRLRITDSGPGIPAAVLPRVFEPFFTTRSRGPGGGLGLSTVYGIVKQSGGYVWVESQPGTGACVTILLPPGTEMPKEVERERLAAPARPRVLLVEDQDGVRELLTTVLQRSGFDVSSAGSGEAALELCAGATFDILLTDIVLPGITGLDVARHVRREAPETHVLFMSGYTGDAVLDITEFGGEVAFIQKPFSSKALVEQLRSLLEPLDDDTDLRATTSR